MKKVACFIFLLALSACNSDDDGADSFGDVTPEPPHDDTPTVSGPTAGANPFPWNRYFVTEFDEAEVQKIRKLAGYVANAFAFNLQIEDHPIYGGKGAMVQSHPLAAARLDYALSTGLTGSGQIVSMIDSGIRLSHEQFDDKDIYTSGQPSVTGDFHGTAVASVMAGNGANGGTLGFAPGADIHQGYIDFSSSVQWASLGQHMKDAADLGAIVSNNSWGLVDSTARNTNIVRYFQGSSRRPYIDGLRTFAKDGVIVFALQNDYMADSASLMAALPLGFPDLESNWISVINAIPVFDDESIQSATRLSTACLETARFCMAANGQIMVAAETGDDDYKTGVGASFAAPQVAGSVALLAEAFPDLTAAQLRDRLLATADNGFFTHDSEHEFAAGITHGYNKEFGHGFLDLRSALLPIGQAVVPMANGGSVALGTAAITAGAASGDGLSQSLASMSILTTDQLHGSFTASGDVLAGEITREDPATVALLAALRPDAGAARRNINAAIRNGGDPTGYMGAWSDASGAQMVGSEIIPLTAPASDLGVALMTGNGTTGVSLHRSFDLAGGHAQVGFTTMHTQGSILGVSVPRTTGEITSVTNALSVGFTKGVSADAALRLNAEVGLANGDGAGMVSDFTTVSYNRIGVAFERANVGRTGDVLAIFARQPIGITRGTARMDLPVQLTDGAASFASRNVSLAPTERQLDLGFEYSVPVTRAGNLSVGLMHSRNDGNIMGRMAVSGFVGVQFSF